jgi:hypothetical protein
VGQDESVPAGQRGDRTHGRLDVALLDGLVHPLSATEERVPTEGGDDQHQRAAT